MPIEESSLKALNMANNEDRKFLEEVQLLRAIANNVPTVKVSKSDVYWFIVSGLRQVLHAGEESPAAKEAYTLLNETLNNVKKAFMKVYNNEVSNDESSHSINVTTDSKVYQNNLVHYSNFTTVTRDGRIIIIM